MLPINRFPYLSKTMSRIIRIFLLMFFVLFGSQNVFSQSHSKPLDLGSLIQRVEEINIFRDSTYFNWGSSIVKGADNLYHLFYSRWKRSSGFGAWLTNSEIAHAVSKNPAGPYKYVATAMTGRGGNSWDAVTAHNPKIKFFEGKYYLYYIATNLGDVVLSPLELLELAGKDLKNEKRNALRRNQRTGVAVSNSLNGPWERLDTPLIEPSGPITTLTVNPAITQGPDKRYYLIIKGDKPNETQFIRNQAMAIADSPAGPFTIQPKPVIGDLDTEDVSLWYSPTDKLFYAIFHAHTYIGLISSADGINWQKAKNDRVTDRNIKFANGTSMMADRMERPFVFLEANNPKVLCLSIKKGNDTFIVLVPLVK